jgi:PAS domain S-box-containing protein
MELLIKALDPQTIKTNLISQSQYISKEPYSKEYKDLNPNIKREALFDAFLVLNSDKLDSNEVVYYSDNLSFDALRNKLPLITQNISFNQSCDSTPPFSILTLPDQYIAFSILIEQRNRDNILVGILNLDHLFKTKVGWASNSQLISTYVYEAENLSRPFYTLQDSVSKYNLDLIENTEAYSFDRLKKNSYVYYEQAILAGQKSWRVLFIPNQHYILASYVIFPWLILMGGLIMASLLGYYSLKLKIRSADLLESQVFVQNIINYAVDGLLTISGNGTIESFNPACEKIFGYKVDHIIGKNIIFLIPELNKTDLKKYLKYVATDSVVSAAGIRKEFEGKRKDGTLFPLELFLSKVKMNNREIFNGTLRDITDRKDAQEMREKLIHQLTENNIELEQFAYVASHDLQEPLRTITNYTSLIVSMHRENLDKEVYKYVSICMHSAKRMQELVSGLLEYASLGQNSTRFHNVDCNQIIKSVMNNLSVSIKERNAIIKYDKLPEVYGSPILLLSLFQNLINNGLKYQPEHQSPKINIACKDYGHYWLMSISDNGLGIEKKYTKKIFLPFKRLHSKHDFPGSGIGLAMCKRIIIKSKGKIWVESSLGKGSTFYFTLLKAVKNKR